MTRFDTYVIVNGDRLFVDPSDQRAATMLRRDGDMHPAASALWRHALGMTRWDHVVDIGANYGEMLVGTPLPDDATITAIEPSTRVLPYVVETLRLARPQARVLSYAVSDTEGQVTLYEDLTWSGNSTLSGAWVTDKADHLWRPVRVPAITLTALLGEIGVAWPETLLMKIDIEGYERKVLQPAFEPLSALARCAVMVEIVRMDDNDLGWLLANFAVSVLDTTQGTLVDVTGASCGDFREMIGRGGLYRRDVLAVPVRGA
jgi:FkbM family methyltransferase